MKGVSRRDFVKSSIAAGVIVALPFSRIRGANDRILVGLVGLGGRGTGAHLQSFENQKGVTVVALSDADRERMTDAAKIIESKYKHKVEQYLDMRKMFDRKDIDVIGNATQNYWHGLSTIWACQASKHVYVEKPLTLTVAEGQRLVKVASMYSRILQTGLQRRSSGAFRNVCELVRNGRIGRLTQVEVGIIGINKGVQAGQNFPNTPVPEGFDYDMWLGPAQFAPFSPQRIARGNDVCYWYYISDYTAGFITGNGVHFVDIAQWGIGDEVKPLEVNTLSAKIPTDGLVDDAIAWHSEIVYENGVTMNYSSEDNPYPDGIRFSGTEGWIHITGGGTLSANPTDLLKSTIGPNEIHLYASPEHHRNFLDCIKTRRPAAAHAEIGHHATTTCNLVEISARLGCKLKWNPKIERFVNDEAADRFLSRAMRSPWHI